MDSFLQTSAWGRFQQSYGYPVQSVDGTLYIQKRIPFGPYLLCSRCMLRPGFAPPKSEAIFIRYEPDSAESYESLKKYAHEHRRQVRPQHSVQPRQTSILDLTKPDDDILAAMHQKHRYNIRLAMKQGVTVDTFSAGLLDGPFDRFWNLLAETSERQSFRLHPRSYYKAMVEALEHEGMVHVHVAHHNKTDLAALIMITHGGTATYLHGGSTSVSSQVMAPYALHWETIRRAKELGCASYDLWGTDAALNPDTGRWEPKKGARSYGTTRFKLGFGGTIVEYPGAFDLVLRPFWYSMYSGVRRVRGSGNRAFS